MHAPGVPPSAGGGGVSNAYLGAIRRHWRLVAAVTLAALLSAVAWATLRSPTYEATAQVLVTPLSATDDTYFGLQVLRDSGDDPTRVLKTAATILRSPAAAQRAAGEMGPGWNAKRILDGVEVSPEAQSSILNVKAHSGKAAVAARLANTFTRASLAARAATLQAQIATTIKRLQDRERVFRAQGATPPAGLSSRIDELEAISSNDDPTLSLTESASPPTSPAGVSTPVLLILSLIVGATLGAGAAVLVELLNRRIRDEEEATDLYPLPVLARIPLVPKRARQSLNGAAWVIPPPVHEAFRTVLAQLTSSNGGGGGGTIMVTSASTGDGKTTSSVNLAVSIAATGQSVVLIDFDIRKPDVARALGLPNEQPIVSLVSSQNSDEGLSKLLTSVPGLPNLSVLAPARMPDGAIGLIEALHQSLPAIIKDAKKNADYVIIDTAPLGEVSDGFRVASEVDRILVVTRPGQTNRANFEVMRDLLVRTGRPVAGLLVIGTIPGATNRYYDYTIGVRRKGALDSDRGVLARMRR